MNMAIAPRTKPTNRMACAHVSLVSSKIVFKTFLTILILSVTSLKNFSIFFKNNLVGQNDSVSEARGFEPLKPFGLLAFKTSAFNHSAMLP